MHAAKAGKYPAYFLVVTRVVGARREVQLATAAPEMRYRKRHIVGSGEIGKCLRIMAAGIALQPMKLHQQYLLWWCGRGRVTSP